MQETVICAGITYLCFLPEPDWFQGVLLDEETGRTAGMYGVAARPAHYHRCLYPDHPPQAYNVCVRFDAKRGAHRSYWANQTVKRGESNASVGGIAVALALSPLDEGETDEDACGGDHQVDLDNAAAGGSLADALLPTADGDSCRFHFALERALLGPESRETVRRILPDLHRKICAAAGECSWDDIVLCVGKARLTQR